MSSLHYQTGTQELNYVWKKFSLLQNCYMESHKLPSQSNNFEHLFSSITVIRVWKLCVCCWVSGLTWFVLSVWCISILWTTTTTKVCEAGPNANTCVHMEQHQLHTVMYSVGVDKWAFHYYGHHINYASKKQTFLGLMRRSLQLSNFCFVLFVLFLGFVGLWGTYLHSAKLELVRLPSTSFVGDLNSTR